MIRDREEWKVESKSELTIGCSINDNKGRKVFHKIPENVKICAKKDLTGKFVTLSLTKYGEANDINVLNDCQQFGLDFINSPHGQQRTLTCNVAVLCLIVTTVEEYMLPIVTCVPNLGIKGEVITGTGNNSGAAHAEEISCFMVHSFLAHHNAEKNLKVNMYYHLFSNIQSETRATTPCLNRCDALHNRMAKDYGYKNWQKFDSLEGLRTQESRSGTSPKFLDLSIFSRENFRLSLSSKMLEDIVERRMKRNALASLKDVQGT